MKPVKNSLCLLFGLILLCVAMPQVQAASYTIPLGDPFASVTWRTYWASVTLPAGVAEDGDQIVVVDPANGNRIVGGWTVVASQIGSASSLSWNSLASGPGFTPGNTYTFFYWDQSTDTNYENCTIGVVSFAGSYDASTFPAADGQLSAFNLTFTNPTPTVTLSSSTATIPEAAGSATLTATLSFTSSQDVTVDLGFTGTATGGGTDYTTSGSSIVITAGNLSNSITVTAVQDVIDEVDETVIVDITSVTNGTEDGTQQETITIEDDEAGSLVFSSTNYTHAEGDGGSTTATITVNRVSGNDGAISVNYATSDNTATVGSDYASSSGTLNWADGDTVAKTFTVTVNGDTIDEPDETVDLTLSSPTGGATIGGTNPVTLTITDDDAAPTVTLSADTNTIAEATGVATLTATLSNASAQNVTVNLIYGGTATGGGVDYTASTSSITINAGATTGTATVTAVQDAVDEADETVIADISSVTNATESGTQQETITITDDDPTPTVTLSVNNATIAEAAGSSTITATLSAATSFDVTVDLAYTGTATGGGTDYNSSAPSITINAGGTSGTASVTAVQDVIDEPNETIVIDITSVSNATESGTQQETVTIIDDDNAPTVTLSVNNATIAENGGTSTVTATLSTTTTSTVTVNLGYTGTATGSGTDYTASAASIIINPGSTTGTALITAVDDILDEDDETVIVDITSVTNATEDGTQQETVTITDDDATPTVTLSVDTATIAEAAGVATFTATLSDISGRDVTIGLGLTGTATGGGTDYTASATTINISAGASSGTITVTAVQDALDELNETVIVDITSATNASESATQQETVTITDDDSQPTVTLSAGAASIAENGGATTFTATLSAASSFDVTVDLSFSGTATGSGTDYSASGSSISITAGSTSGSVTVTAIDDPVDESDETIIADITTVTNGTESGTQQETVTILDDDTQPTVTLSVDTATISEAAGSAVVTATLSAISGQDVTVNLGYTGTATNAVDYSASGTSITITAGDTTGTVTITAIQDAAFEGDETVIIDVETVSNATESGTQQETVTITDDDTLPSVTLSVDTATIVENSGVATLTASLSTTSTQDITVNLAFSGVAVGGGVDYTASAAAIVIPAGSLSATETITADQDLLDEDNETVIVDVNTVINGVENGTQQETVTITDDDATPTVTLSVNAATIAEASGTSTVTATLSAVSGRNVTINLGFTGTATGGGVDYTTSAALITITAGNPSGSITVTADQDTLDENNETVIVDIIATTNATEAVAQQETVTITDDDNPPTVALSVNNATISETGGSSIITATLSTASSFDVTVDLAYSGTALGSGTDYTASATSIIISAGATTGTATVSAVSDTLDELDESVIVDITNVTNGTEDGVQTETITITDDDNAPNVTLSVNTSTIAEAGGVATVTATLDAASGQNVTVDLVYSGTATIGGVDYNASAASIIISAGSTNGTVTVTAVQDPIDEPNETVIVDIDSVTNGLENGTQQEVITITDDDATPTVTLSVDTATISEAAGVATVTATLSAASGQDVTVNLAYTGTATGGGVDYTASAASISISAGATTGTVTVTADEDVLDEDDETVIVDISTVTNATEAVAQQVTVTITDNDAEPTVTLAAATSPIAEAGGTSVLTATLSSASGRTVTVNLAFSGTATGGGTDYSVSSSAITINAGDTTGTATITAVDDTLDEVDEDIVVDIDTVVNATEAVAQQDTVTITDDDNPPTVTLSTDVSAISEAAGVSTVTATLSTASSQTVTVNLGFTGTATGPGTDYNTSGTTITINPGSPSGSITVTAVQDVLSETDETVIVDITGVTNGTESGIQQETITITDDDSGPIVSLSVDTATIAEASGVATVTATLSAISGQNITVNLAYSGTATGGSVDYTASATSITILAGSPSGTVTVTADQDLLDEANETVVVDITTVVNATEDGTQQQTITITDDDATPSVTLSTNTATIPEAAGVATLTATLSAVSGQEVTVDLGFSGTATGGGTDYTESATSITIPAGSPSASITVTAVQDILSETDETIIVDVTTLTNATENGVQQETVTILDDEGTPVITLSVDTASIPEAAGVATLTATSTVISAQDVTVNLGFTGTASGSGTDYTASAASIVISAGSATGTATITAVQDTVDEADETVIVDITGVTNGTESGTQQETVTITDDDASPTVVLSVDTATIAEAAGVATITATSSEISEQNITVNLVFSGTATGGNVDYTASAASVSIPAGSTVGTITVTAVQDTLDEVNESVIVDIDTVVNGTENGTQQETVTITDDDAEPAVTLALDTATIAEAGGVATVTATLGAVSGKDVTVNLGFTGTAVGGSVDYTASAAVITISAGSPSGTITVTADQDTLDEDNETVIVDIVSVVNATESVAQQETITITDDDNPPNVTLAVDNAAISEAGGVATFTATLATASGKDVTVNLTYSGTATAGGVDYTSSSASIAINAGATTGSVTVTAVDDAISEGDETVIVDIDSVVNATEAVAQQETTTITDNDSGPTVTLSVDNSIIAENGGVATVTATLSGASGQTVTVDLAYSGTATGSGVDYTASTALISIPAGSTTGTAVITSVDDALGESDETVIVDVSSVTNGTEDGTQQVTVTITDDDASPNVFLSVDTTTIAEAGGVATLTASLSILSGQDVVVTLGLTGSATSGGVDYTASSTTITIPAGSVSSTATITAVQDTLDEIDETVIVDVVSVAGGNENGTQTETITITDDDPTPNVSLSVDTATIAEAAGAANLTASLDAISGQNVSVVVSYSGLATGGGTDYTANTLIIIPAGSLSASIAITAVQDLIDEFDETVIADITSVTNANENGSQQETVTILDDDAEPTVTLSVDTATIAEAAGVSNLTIALSAASGRDITVNLGYTGTATAGGVDYTASDASVTIPAGSLNVAASVTAVQDTIDEADETIVIDITSVTNGTESGTQQETVTITDDDAAPNVTLTVDNLTIAEGGGVATLTATLDAVSSQDVTVDLGYTGTATSGVDYSASTTSIIIPAGSPTATATVTAIQDTTDEADETVIVDVTAVTNGTESGAQQVTVTITDDDAPPIVTLSTDLISIAENGGVATLTATLSAISTFDVTVDLGFTGTATGGGTDYTASASSIVISAGNTTGTITVTAVDDVINEANETVIVDITSVTNGSESGTQQETVTITDDDAAPAVTLSVDTATIAEAGGVATVTATLSYAPLVDVTVNLAYSGTATGSGTDYSASSSVISIPAGNSTGSVTITAVDDIIDEADETVLVDITSVTNGNESGTQQVTVTILDDDAGPSVTLTTDLTTIPEAAGVATVTATLDAVSAQDVTVDLGYTGTATGGGVDYTVSSASIVIPAGNVIGTATVTAVQDVIDEDNETVIVDITSVTNGSENGTQQETVTIADDDLVPSVSISVDTATIAEAGGVATVTASLSEVSGKDVTVNVTYSGTATGGGVDYNASASSVTILAGATTGTATITAVDDLIDEVDETVIIDVDTVINGAENGTQQVTVTITDDDAGPTVTLSVDTATIVEAGGVATLTATLSNVSTQDVTVGLAYTGTATGGGTDYSASAGTIVVIAGNTTGTATVTAVDDAIDELDETVIVDVSFVTNGSENGTQQETVTITDDDLPPTVTLSTDLNAISENGGVATLTATLSETAGQDVTVTLSYGGTATGAGVDYTASSTTIVISAGTNSGTATITAVDDALSETNETVIVDITAVTNAAENGTQQEIVVITDDDSQPVVTLGVLNALITEAGGISTMTLTLSTLHTSDVTVTLGYSGTATGGGVDYTNSATSVVIPAGSIAATASVTAIQDLIDETNETVIVDITSVVNANENGTQQGTITIIDDDATPIVNLTSDANTIAEAAGVATVTATLSAVSGLDVTIDLTYGGTALALGDYTASDSTMTIPAGSTTASVTVTAVQDAIDEPDETVIVDISSITNANENSTQQETITILDDDATPTVTLSVDTATIVEAAGIAVVTATIDAVSGQNVTVDLAYTGTATGLGVDYSTTGSLISIPAGSTTGTVILTAVQDVLDELDETIIVDITSVTNAIEALAQQETVTITDDDAPPSVTLSVNPAIISETGGIATLTVSLSAASSFDVTADLGYTGTATGAGVDYVVSATSITVPAGSTTATSTVTAISDGTDEPDETVIVDITAVTNGSESGVQQETVTITDDDSAPSVTLTVDAAVIAENGGVAVFTATLSGTSTQDVTVNLGFGGTASQGVDYANSDTQIIIPNGSTSGTITVTGIDDALTELSETVIVSITTVVNAVELVEQEATTAIADDDGTTVSLSVDTASISENADVATITATLSNIHITDVSVTLSYGGTATGSIDYAVNNIITIPAGDTDASIVLTSIEDPFDEPDETVIIDIQTVGNATENGIQTQTVTILDNDIMSPPDVTLSASSATIAENGGTATITAQLSSVYASDVTVNLVNSGSAVQFTDYTVSGATIVIPAGSTSGTVTVTAIDNAIVDVARTIVTDISSVTNGIELGAQQVIITITDDESTGGGGGGGGGKGKSGSSGCNMGSSTVSSLLPILFLAALVGLIRRRRQSDC